MTEARKIAKHAKSRAGCLKCKQRHLKCDETIPECLNCVKKGLLCLGYVSPVKWSTKHELLLTEARKSPKLTASRSGGGEAVSVRSNAVSGRRDIPVVSSPLAARGESIELFASDHSSMSKGSASLDHSEGDQSQSAGRAFETSLISNEAAYSEYDDPLTYILHRSYDEQDYWPTVQNGTTSIPSENSSNDIQMVPFIRSRSVSPVSGLFGNYEPNLSNRLSEAYEIANYEDSLAGHRKASGKVRPFLGPFVHTPSIPLAISDDMSSTLLHHYFSRTCQINSGFDSAKNPFRTTVSKLLHESLLMRNCILSMSAAHIASSKPEMASTALKMQTEAISCLSNEVANLGASSSESILLGIIILGMSSSWHNPSASGITHLKGARSFFKSWMHENETENTDPTNVDEQDRRCSFLVGAMSYWEALSSFLMDQKLDAREYLKPFCCMDPLKKVYPNPWTGISTPLYIWLAEVGTLVRQKQLAVKFDTLHQQHLASGVLLSYMSEHAFALEASLLSYICPSEEVIEDTEDAMTSKLDLQNISEIYRLTALLELYRAFPNLIDRHTPMVSPEDQEVSSLAERAYEEECGAGRSAFLFDICLGIVQLMRAISEESGALSLLLFPLICAGAGLQYQMVPKANNLNRGPRWRSLGLQLAAIRQDSSTVDQWRNFVRNRIIHFHRRVGLDPIKWAAKIIEQVWSRADFEHAINSDSTNLVYWMDVMMELRLETVFG